MKTPNGFTESDLASNWDKIANSTKFYHDAYSTRVYFDQERRLIQKYFAPLEGKTLLKTDLWNEAKNTQILKWAADQKARVHGFDISRVVTKQALTHFHDNSSNAHFTIADLRNLPYATESFDYVYSMGTLEHFPDYEKGAQELYRILKKGGRAIIGVPNKLDPFLRPFQVYLLRKLGFYAFGYEKSFSKQEMTELLSRVNFKIKACTSLLFMPGILRIIDLFFYCHIPALSKLSKIFMAPFAFLYNRFEFCRRHGYLIAIIVKKI